MFRKMLSSHETTGEYKFCYFDLQKNTFVTSPFFYFDFFLFPFDQFFFACFGVEGNEKEFEDFKTPIKKELNERNHVQKGPILTPFDGQNLTWDQKSLIIDYY